MLTPRRLLVLAVVAAVVFPGCEFGRRYVNKPWGAGTYVPAIVCGAIGAGVGVLIEDQIPGTSKATIYYPDGSSHTEKSKDDAEYWRGGTIGAVSGAALCALVGHYLFDPEVTPAPTPTATPEPLPPPSSKRIVLRGVHFDFDKSELRADSRPTLEEAADTLKDNTGVHVTVEGHTDSQGTEIYNERLSVRRAEAVFRYLVNRGIAPERMEVVGYGESKPVASNDTEEGRAQNRRVELHVANQPAERGTHLEPSPVEPPSVEVPAANDEVPVSDE